jgi:hypothetical protein
MVNTNELPDRETLDERLEVQREALFRVAGIVCMVQHVPHDSGSQEDGSIDQNTAVDAYMALKVARDLIDDVTGRLDPNVMFREESPS